ncbi:unnamed protein product [Oikopleura dioica]|uniref:Ion transport domain-containing protein n=1 Tax=Oikopleura dioica TaxID=34765 RepID=E4XJ66_OIKDI|nr:unnamed protein product [Oikopleura dioica]
MMAENLNTCDCFGELGSSACNDWCDTTTKNVSLASIQNINEPLFPDLLSDTTPPPQDTIDTSQCCKYQRLLQTWIRMGYTTFGLLSLFFIETIVKLAALPHLLSRKMEIADAMLVILSWIMCFIIVFSLEETDCNASEPSEGGLNGMKGVVMLTFRMLRIFNGLAMLFANFFEGKILRYQEKIKFQTQQLNQSQEEKKRLATTAQKILRDKQNLQLQLQAVTMSYNQTQQNNGPPRGPPGGGVGFAQPSGILALPTIHSPIQGGHTSDEAIENLIEHEITAAESALASQSTRVTEINDTEVHHATPSSSFLPPIAQGNAPALIITPPTQETLDFPEDQTQHRNTNPFDS